MHPDLLITRCLSALTICILFFTADGLSQNVFWAENFNNGCTSNCPANSYTGPNGQWAVTAIGTQGGISNNWFVSCSENGNGAGNCGTNCGTNANATLHIGENIWPNFDAGATYNKGGGFQNVTTNKRGESPAISTIGKINITLSFEYMENGDGTNDDGSVYYSTDGGISWTLLVNSAKTTLCGGGIGQWAQYTGTLPPSCENISNLKIGFLWVNNNDGFGTNPSFAIDNVSLSTPTTGGNAPVANFNSSATTLCAGQCISFTDLSTNTPTSWSWTFNGGTPSSSISQNPSSICYNTPGTYDVSLTASNATGNNTKTMIGYITVISSTSAPGAISGMDTVCTGQSNVSYSIAPVGGAVSYSWIVPAGTVLVSGQGTTNILVNFANNGGTICVSAVSACGSSAQTCISVVVDPCSTPPIADFAADNTTICAGSCINFLDMSFNGPASWSWNFSGASPSSSSLQSPYNICYPAPGNYAVTLVASNTAGSDTIIKNSYITVLAGPTVLAYPDTSVSVGATVQLAASGGVSYSWAPSAFLNNTTVSNPQSTPVGPMTYTVFVTDANGCSSFDTVRIDMIYKNVLWVPGAFSPNNDGLNDLLFAHATNVKNFYFAVFNRWEEKVFESKDPLKGWDGLIKGNPAYTGIFIYYARVEFMNGTKEEKRGNVMLMK